MRGYRCAGGRAKRKRMRVCKCVGRWVGYFAITFASALLLLCLFILFLVQQKDFEDEKVRRMKVEGEILNRLANHEHHVASKFEKIRVCNVHACSC